MTTKIKIAVATFAALLSISALTAADCPSCPKVSDAAKEETAAQKAENDKKFERLLAIMHDTTLDNKEDSTTKRAFKLGSSFEGGFPLHGYFGKSILEKVQNLLIEAIKKDPYPSVRAAALGNLARDGYPNEIKYKVCTDALDDPNIFVKNIAAISLLELYKRFQMPLNVRAEKIVSDLAVGRGRSNWNLKGFYKKTDFDKNPQNTIENSKNDLQTNAIYGLKYYLRTNDNEGKVFDYLDSVAQNDPSEEVRKSAKHGKELFKN